MSMKNTKGTFPKVYLSCLKWVGDISALTGPKYRNGFYIRSPKWPFGFNVAHLSLDDITLHVENVAGVDPTRVQDRTHGTLQQLIISGLFLGKENTYHTAAHSIFEDGKTDTLNMDASFGKAATFDSALIPEGYCTSTKIASSFCKAFHYTGSENIVCEFTKLKYLTDTQNPMTGLSGIMMNSKFIKARTFA